MPLTKIDVAEAHLISAVRLYFQGGPIPSVHLLAASAREILTTIGQKIGVRTMLVGIAEAVRRPLKELISFAHKDVRFLKHADSDPTALMDDISERDLEILLFVACHDFGRIAKGMAIEMQVYEAWCLTRHWPTVSEAPLKLQPILRKMRKRFPGITTLDSQSAKKLGRLELQKAMDDPALRMAIQREVVIPDLDPDVEL